jgi:hypothetical protein
LLAGARPKPCYRGSVVFIFFVDDGLFFSPNKADVDQAIKDLKDEKKA